MDVGWIIYNNIIDLVRPLKGLWSLAIITQLCIQSGVRVEKNEKKIKTRLAISLKTSTDELQIRGHILGAKILEKLNEIRAIH